MANPSGWYPDPDGKPCERFWNGLRWTEKTRPVSKPGKIGKKILPGDDASPTEKKVALTGCLVVALLFMGGCLAISNSGESKPTTSTQKDTTTISTPEPTKEVDLQMDAVMGGFESDELQKIKEVRESLYNFVFAWSGLVAGTSTYPEVSIYCSNLEDANNYIRGVDSDSPYFEDLLDRAKDYLYETRSECEYAFKKNRLEDLGQSAENASAGIAFFDQIISKSEENK